MPLVLRLIGVQLRAQMQYRASFWIDVLGTFVLQLTGIVAILSGLSTFGAVAGWSISEVAFLYGMVEVSFGLMDMIFSGFDPPWFSTLVKQGQFTQLLLRPAGLWTQVLGSAFLLRRLARVGQGALVLIVALLQLQIEWTLVKVLYLPLVIAGQVMCYGALFVVGSAIVFWTIDSVEAINILTYGSTEMTMYPMTVYPDWLRNIFTFLVPTIFMNYFPALYFLGKPDPLGFPTFAPFIAPFVGAAMLIVSIGVFRIGLRHYQGTGT